MAASSDRSNVLLYASTTLSVVTICLFVVSCCYFQSVINVQNEQLVLLTEQQDNLKNEVSTLKRKLEEQDANVSLAVLIMAVAPNSARTNSSSVWLCLMCHGVILYSYGLGLQPIMQA